MTKVTAVVVNWKRQDDTLACIASLRAQDCVLTEIVVVDNGSDDGSEEHIRSVATDVAVLQSGRNLGFGGGCNIGIRRALAQGMEFVLLVNNDALLSTATLGHMLERARQHADAGAVGAVFYDSHDGHLQCWGGGRVQAWLGLSRKVMAPGPLDYLTAACVLLRCSALEQVGLFDEKTFFMYWEDVDLCLRLQGAGWKLVVAENAHVLHQESVSLGKGSLLLDRYSTTSQLRWMKRYAPAPWATMFVAVALRLGKRLLHGQLKRCRAVLQGWQEA